MATPGKIRKLDEVVVNRIAAGEIIQRPANALKELIENSLDAKSTNIQVSVKEGGLKFLQIQDNGTGIRKDDLNIVCERFTTSKLQSFDDLKSISTFGFRGEALASISHVAQLTITTKTADEKCAYRASYVDGKLKGPPVPCAGNQGTIITVENLFYNVATRRKALSSFSEELAKISDVVTRYAIHNPGTGFTLKKHGESSTLVKTPHSSTKINNIRIVFGNNVAKDLLEINLNDSTYKFKLNALISNANYTSKKMTFLLFINHRLVDSTPLKKTVEDMYTIYLPKKAHPWCYISLEIEPQNVDVNVHPTKHEVRFLHEDTIIEKVRNSLDEKLAANDASRTFYIQAKLPQMDLNKEPMQENSPDSQEETDKLKKIHPKEMIRMDSFEQKLDKFNFTLESANKDSHKITHVEKNKGSKNINSSKGNVSGSQESGSSIEFKSYSVNQIRVETNLLSVLTLRKEVEESYHEGLRKILSNLIFVGCIDESSALIQSDVNLYICNTQKIAEEFFYEIMLYDFANYGVIKFSEPLLLQDLARLGLDCQEAGWSEDAGDKSELAARVQELLLEKADLLRQYFSIYIDKKGYLKTLPLLLENYYPNYSGIPLFILRLSTEVDWNKEKPCFHDICRETAKFYSSIDITDESWRHMTEHVLYNAVKESFLPPKYFSEDSSILQIASLPDLYKIFERC